MDAVQEDFILEECPLCECYPCDCEEYPGRDNWDGECCWICWEPLRGSVCNVCGEGEEGNWLAWLE